MKILLEVGVDLTELLGITKYEPPIKIQMGAARVSTFPPFIPKTDEIRVQSAPGVIDELWGKPYYITQKMDGTSATYYAQDYKLHICSRNQEIVEDNPNGENLYWKIARKYGFHLSDGIAIQGEICGPGIQKNRLKLFDHEFYPFNIWNIDSQQYLPYDSLLEFAKLWQLPIIPLVASGSMYAWTLEQLLEMAVGTYSGTGNQREGIVVRPESEMQSLVLKGRLSFKVISNEYLIQNNL